MILTSVDYTLSGGFGDIDVIGDLCVRVIIFSEVDHFNNIVKICRRNLIFFAIIKVTADVCGVIVPSGFVEVTRI